MRRVFAPDQGSPVIGARLQAAGRLVLATHNPGKVREIEALVAPLGLQVMSAGALGLPEPEETEDTFVGNALLKARAAAGASGFPALSDDSGFSVAALDGAPGVLSARWAGPGRDFALAMQKVWAAVEQSGRTEREAWFTCVLALAFPDGEAHVFEGRVEGRIAWPPRGDNGFGFDPMFTPEGAAQTFGEMEPDAKHAVSHRARAFATFLAALA